MGEDLVRYDTSRSRPLAKTAAILGGAGALACLITPWVGVPLLGAGAYFGFRWFVTNRAERGKRV